MPRYFSNKFNDDGSVKEYPGTTIISKIRCDAPEHVILTRVQDDFRALPISSKYGFLPSSSFHMTVAELLNDKSRQPGIWSKHLPLDLPFSEVLPFLRSKWPEIVKPRKISMVMNTLSHGDVLCLSLRPADGETMDELKDFRNAVAEKLGVKKPGHETYGFHITLAYRLFDLTDGEQNLIATTVNRLNKEYAIAEKRIEFAEPELCFYKDMSRFNSAYTALSVR